MSQARPNILPKIFLTSFILIRVYVYCNGKSRQVSGLGSLASRGDPVCILEGAIMKFQNVWGTSSIEVELRVLYMWSSF